MSLASFIQPARIRELLYDAVCEYSPTYAEQPSVAVFERAIMEADLRVESQVVATPGAEPDDPRRNLIIRLGPEPVELLWLGHTDTVVLPDDETHDPFVKDGVLHGLGSADMKAGCVAAIEAAIALRDSGLKLKRGIAIGLVVGEEEYGDGAERIVERIKPPLAIVGEPTDLEACFEHYGYFEAELETRGRRAHAAVPEFGANAIHAMLQWLMSAWEIRATRARKLVLNPRGITGSSPLFAVPEACYATLDAHIHGNASVDEVIGIINDAMKVAAAEHEGCTFDWSEVFFARGYKLDVEDPDLSYVRDSYGAAGVAFKPTAFRSHSDAAFLAGLGIKTIVAGPGKLSVAHTPEERVHLKKVEQAALLYAEMFARVGGAYE